MQPPDGVLETCLYAEDLEAGERFYGTVLGLVVLAREPERHCFFRCGSGMLLLFNPKRTGRNAGEVGGVAIPPHGARGPGHVALSVSPSEIPGWQQHLRSAGVPIEADISWPGGGRSLYVRDPAGNSVEIATSSIWDQPYQLS